jgi:hypothetical protein
LDRLPDVAKLEATLAEIQQTTPKLLKSDLAEIARQYIGGDPLSRKDNPIKMIRKIFIERARTEGDIEMVRR